MKIFRELSDSRVFFYSGTLFRGHPVEIKPSGKATEYCKSKHKCIDERPSPLKGHISNFKG